MAPDTDWTKSVSKNYLYEAAATAFGVGLKATSGYSDNVKMYWATGTEFKEYYLFGRNNQPDLADIVYASAGDPPSISPPTQTTSSSGAGSWTVTAPHNKNRPTTLSMAYGDGVSETRAITQGTGSTTFSFSHTFSATGTYTQRAVIVETGATAQATTFGPNVAGREGGFVGVMKVKGNRADSGTVTATGGQPANDNSGARSQTVSSGIARADKARLTAGNFSVWTGARTDNGWKLDAGTYDLNWFNGGSLTDGYAYGDHASWNYPAGDCMTQNIPIAQVSKLGTVTIDANGNISGGASSGGWFVSYDSTTKYATFKWDVATAKVSVPPKESAICISEANSQDKNMAPITVM